LFADDVIFTDYNWRPMAMTKIVAILFAIGASLSISPANATVESYSLVGNNPTQSASKRDFTKIAIEHACGAFGKANKCHAKWDRGTSQCRCIGK
jgi:hypothetical protein